MNGIEAVKLMTEKEHKTIKFSATVLTLSLIALFTGCYILWLMLEIK